MEWIEHNSQLTSDLTDCSVTLYIINSNKRQQSKQEQYVDHITYILTIMKNLLLSGFFSQM